METTIESYRKSYWKTIALAAGVSVLATAAAIAMLPGGASLLWWILAGASAIVAILTGAIAAGGLLCLRREANQKRGIGWQPRTRSPREPSGSVSDWTQRNGSPRVGDWVEVHSAEEILATLDSDGALDALPFMPEMLSYCGMRLPVSHSADKILDMIDKTGHRIRRMHDATFLDDVRCDGSAHGGCQQGCRIIWKNIWLRPAGPAPSQAEGAGEAQPAARDGLMTSTRHSDATDEENILYQCQATELFRASTPMHPWDPRPELRSLTTGNVFFSDFALIMLVRAFNFAQQRRGGITFPEHEGTCSGRTPHERLDLQPGEWIQVKSLREIKATIDENGRNRGLSFDREMVRFCGGRYRVQSRVDRIIDERTGRMLRLGNPCIILEGVEATGEFIRFNPQREYPYWREIWLRRAD